MQKKMFHRCVNGRIGKMQNKKLITPDNSYLLLYKESIDAGDIIVGGELYTELENLIDDLLHNDDYYYDTADAIARMDFMQNCVRLTKSPFYNKPMVLMLWQKAFIETVYSFKMQKDLIDTGKVIDRFKQVLLLIARKNTKSETCSALALSEFIVGNEGADIVCSSNDDNQASLTYDAIDTMRLLIDPNGLDTHRNQRYILNKITNTKVFKLSDRTKNKEGRNIDFAIVDEVHEMKTNVIAKSIEQSQSLKDNPKEILITTEGFIDGGYLDELTKRARSIINKEDDSIAAARFLPWLYTQDSEQEIFNDPSTWYKSNPTLGIVKKVSYLEEQVDLAKSSKADRIFVLSKDFNFKQNKAVSWLNLEDFNYDATFDIEELRGSVILGFVDLSQTTDLCCAKALTFKNGIYYILTMYFVPKTKLLKENDDHNADAKYKEWSEDGFVIVSPGNDIDLSLPAKWFYDLYKNYNIKLYKCGYDQRFAKEWIKAMETYGWSKETDLELILQNAETLNNAIQLVEAELKCKSINYNNNSVTYWCLKNACLKVNDKRQALIVKGSNHEKRIDGAVSLVGVFEMLRRYRTELKNIWG